jgi:hypothetical protein
MPHALQIPQLMPYCFQATLELARFLGQCNRHFAGAVYLVERTHLRIAREDMRFDCESLQRSCADIRASACTVLGVCDKALKGQTPARSSRYHMRSKSCKLAVQQTCVSDRLPGTLILWHEMHNE